MYEGNITFSEIQNTIDTQKDAFNESQKANIVNTLSIYEIYGESKMIVEAGFNDI